MTQKDYDISIILISETGLLFKLFPLKDTKHHHRKESVHFPRNCALWPSTRTTDAQTFSKHIPNIWPDFDRFGHISQNFVTVLSVHEFHDDKSFFLQKVKIFIHLKGIYKYILGFGV